MYSRLSVSSCSTSAVGWIHRCGTRRYGRLTVQRLVYKGLEQPRILLSAGVLEPVPGGYRGTTGSNKNSKVNKIGLLYLVPPYSYGYLLFFIFLISRWKWVTPWTDFNHLYRGSPVHPRLIKHMLTRISSGEEIYCLARRLARLQAPSVQWAVPGGRRGTEIWWFTGPDKEAGETHRKQDMVILSRLSPTPLWFPWYALWFPKTNLRFLLLLQWFFHTHPSSDRVN